MTAEQLPECELNNVLCMYCVNGMWPCESFQWSNSAKAKLTISMPIGRLSTTVWVEGAQHKKVQRKTAKKWYLTPACAQKTTHTCLLPNAVST